MVIRSATKEDCESCMRLVRQLWVPEYNLVSYISKQVPPDKFHRIYDCILDNPDCEVIVAEKDEQIVAMMDMDFHESFFHGGLTMQIEDLIVEKRFRRQGIGQRMVGLAEDMARQRGAVAVKLSSDLYREDTHRFWESMGYEIEAYELRKDLSPVTASQA